MDFEYLHKIAHHVIDVHGYYIDNVDRFYRFIDEYNAIGVRWGQPTTISASYFIRVRHQGGTINEGGLNKKPRTWDSGTGLNNNP